MSTNFSTPQSDFLDVHKRWHDCVAGTDTHAIWRQIATMLWDAAAFFSINEARRLAEPLPDGRVQLNGMMHSLINMGFFNAQRAAIRRLVDPGKMAGNRGVYALTSLITDMISNIDSFTRENIFAAEGLIYDYEEVKGQALAFDHEHRERGETAYRVPRALIWEKYDQRHIELDQLTDMGAKQRSRTDKIRIEVLKHLNGRLLEACEKISAQVDQFIAHSATPESRQHRGTEAMTVTLADLWDAHRVIVEVANFVSVYLLGGSELGTVPIPQFDQFEFIEQPLVRHADVTMVRKAWDEFEQRAQKWNMFDIRALQGEMHAKMRKLST